MAISTWAVFRVKNEADIIRESVSWMLTQVDEVLVADGRSTDGTREILEELPVTLVDDDTPTYSQAEVCTDLAHRARDGGADWVISADGDEIWHAVEGRIADQLEDLPDNILIADAALLDHRCTSLDDLSETNPLKRLQWRLTQPLPLRKVAARARADLTLHPGNHGASFADVRRPARVADVLGVRHFPYRSPEQFIRKIEVGSPALLDDPEAPEGMGAHWQIYGRILREKGADGLRAHFAEWFFIDDPVNDPQVILDPAPLS